MKKLIYIHVFLSIIISIYKIYKIIFVDGFEGSLGLTILKEVGILLLIYWGVLLLLWLVRMKIVNKE